MSFSLLLVVCGILLSFINTPNNPELSLNAPIPLANEKMKDVNGKDISLNEVKTTKGLLVIFSCNNCPYVRLSEGRIKEISDYCLKEKIGCIIVNSNEAQRSEDDSYEAMVAHAATQKLTCPYIIDLNSKLADAFGASITPQCFLFNGKGLVYKGAIDDNVKDPTGTKHPYLKEAIHAVLTNELPMIQETKSIGCTIKRLD